LSKRRALGGAIPPLPSKKNIINQAYKIMCYFDDIQPELRTKEELYILLLSEMVTGKQANLRRFYSDEVFEAKKYLVNKGYFEGVVDWDEVVYSKITNKEKTI